MRTLLDNISFRTFIVSLKWLGNPRHMYELRFAYPQLALSLIRDSTWKDDRTISYKLVSALHTTTAPLGNRLGYVKLV